MDIFTHYLMAMLIGAFTVLPYGPDLYFFAGTLAIFADFDMFYLKPLEWVTKDPIVQHKGLSHSIFFSLGISAVLAGIFAVFRGYPFLFVWLIGFLFYNLHILLDALAASKVPIFYPLTKKRYRFFIDRAINPLLALCSGTILLTYLIGFFLFPQIYDLAVARVLLIIYSIYFGVRIAQKILFQIRLPSFEQYVPGVIPSSYFIYTHETRDSVDTFRLEKGRVFSRGREIILDFNIAMNSSEHVLLEKALKEFTKYPFSTKWKGILPFISESDGELSVIIFLAESYASHRGYYYQAFFDKTSGAFLRDLENFGEIHVLDSVKITPLRPVSRKSSPNS